MTIIVSGCSHKIIIGQNNVCGDSDTYCHVFKTDIDKVYINLSDSDIDTFNYRVEM